MNKSVRLFLLMLIDACLINLAFVGAIFLRFDGEIPQQNFLAYKKLALYFTIIGIVCFLILGLYNRVWKYASIGELLTVLGAVSVASTLQVTLAYFLMEGSTFPLPRSIFVLSWLLTIILIGGSRLAWRLFRDYGLGAGVKGGKPILIIGAGDAGVMVAKEMKNHFANKVNIVGFIDDEASKKGAKILGIPVLGSRDDIPRIVEEGNIERIILAIPSAPGKVIKQIVEICQQTEAEIQILPGMYDLIEGNVTVSNIREVQVEDLLGRDPVNLDLESISQYLNEKVVLVTGAGGSIGSELCRQIAKFNPNQLLLLDIS